jgi:hypothetical protein
MSSMDWSMGVALYALAVYLARGWRREAIRAWGVGPFAAPPAGFEPATRGLEGHANGYDA